MKKILIGVVCLFIFAGCATDGAYGVAKTAVNVAKGVVKVTDTKVSDNVKDAYELAKGYDEIRGVVRTEVKKSVATPSTETK